MNSCEAASGRATIPHGCPRMRLQEWCGATAFVAFVACSPQDRECIANTESSELTLIVTERHSTRVDPLMFPNTRSDSVVIALVRDSVVRDTVHGRALGLLADIGVEVGPDTLPSRPYYAICRGDSLFMVVDPRIVDKELSVRGERDRTSGAWMTAGFPMIEGVYRLRPRDDGPLIP
jgi:hypothetical protein